MRTFSSRTAARLLAGCAALASLFITSGCGTPPSAATGGKAPAAAPLLPGDPASPSQVTPSEAVAIAETYAHHPWQPFARNILHGPDPSGVRVDTPDIAYRPGTDRDGWWIPGEVNNGIPYKWGGFDDPASFDRAIAAGLAAGDVSTPEKRRADNAAVSKQAAGVDCSGFVSRCLKLPTGHDSSQLPALCDPISNVHELAPGDLLNIPHRHVLLVAGWARPDHTQLLYYETGGIPDWKPGLKQAPLAALFALGYQPLRYRGMAREARPSGKEVLTRAIRSRAIVIEHPTIGDP